MSDDTTEATNDWTVSWQILEMGLEGPNLDTQRSVGEAVTTVTATVTAWMTRYSKARGAFGNRAPVKADVREVRANLTSSQVEELVSEVVEEATTKARICAAAFMAATS